MDTVEREAARRSSGTWMTAIAVKVTASWMVATVLLWLLVHGPNGLPDRSIAWEGVTMALGTLAGTWISMGGRGRPPTWRDATAAYGIGVAMMIAGLAWDVGLEEWPAASQDVLAASIMTMAGIGLVMGGTIGFLGNVPRVVEKRLGKSRAGPRSLAR